MITRIRKQLFSLRHAYSNPLDRQRAQVLLFLNLALVVITIISVLFLTIPSYLNTGNLDVSGLISSILVVIASWSAYQMIQRGQLRFAIWIILLAITMGTLSAIVFSGGDSRALVIVSSYFYRCPLL